MIVERFEKQECVGYRQEGNAFVSIYEMVALDTRGRRWQFVAEYLHRPDGKEIALPWFGFRRLTPIGS